MAKIYLVSNTASNDNDVINLSVSDIKFLKFKADLSEFNALVITSKNALKALEFNGVKASENIQIYAIGEPTAKQARSLGFNKIYVAQNAHGDEFAAEIAPLLKGKKTLYLRAKEVVSNLSEILHANGVNLSEIIAYKNIPKCVDSELKPPLGSVIIFTSPLNFKNFILNFGWEDSYKAVAIGQTTANELAKFTNPIVSEIQSVNSCISLAKTLF
ncbi:MAG: uroporphyrinogen-III synthase [Campylobacter sp.]|nr:uroporphyrinogen-III synthase [Campylobacter sp.]